MTQPSIHPTKKYTKSSLHTKVLTCGEATMRLLARYGVDTVFGIPGVHTLDFCRGLNEGPIRHIQARNEQGAGFMADGYARISGRPGVALVISGPGVTNALTAVGQSWADSVPMLLLSSETDSRTHGKGWGALHEIPDQRSVTAPMTALSMRAYSPKDVPEMLAQTFMIFNASRPRPVHLSIPIDVLAMPVDEEWQPVSMPAPPMPRNSHIQQAVEMLRKAQLPLIMTGGGAVNASDSLRILVDQLNAPVVSSTAGKGIVPDDHPLSLNASTVRHEVQEYLSNADVILAVGTELAETDSFVDLLDLKGVLIRIDLDPKKINDQYPATLGIIADAGDTLDMIVAQGDFEASRSRDEVELELQNVRERIAQNLTVSERKHKKLLKTLESSLPENTFYAGDICQLVYTGAFGIHMKHPRSWSYPAGYCTLGCGLPNAIGAKMADLERPVVCLSGDGGFMFTVQELMVASELNLGLPIILWENGGLKQIQDDMRARDIPLVGVEGPNPDFLKLAEAMYCDAIEAESLEHAASCIKQGFEKKRPTLIVVRENSPWLDR
ncbi:MAG: 5-guanidino-2-oxopentanoate decarboxylase [SAR324 cluster bacterium]|nr:5-guanidino-2-oxopentanoate decarboxylase [SAR324 cluster bacterium]